MGPATLPDDPREPQTHAGLAHIVAVMDRLRSPGGCAWDAVQTHQSLAEYLIEETYELLEAIDNGDRDHLREELGDVLLQVVFHCRIAQDDPTDPFDIDEVAEGIAQKLIRRHPHVFADADAPDATATLSNWEAVKAAEKGRQSPVGESAGVLLKHMNIEMSFIVSAPPAMTRSDRPSRSSLIPMLMAEKLLAQAASVTQLAPPRSSRFAIRPATTLPSTPGKVLSCHST